MLQPGAQAEPDLAAVHDLAHELGAIPGRMQLLPVTPTGDEDGPEVEVIVDPDAVSRAEVALGALDKEGASPAEVPGPAERLQRSVDPQAAVVGCQSAANQLREDLGDTERWAGLRPYRI